MTAAVLLGLTACDKSGLVCSQLSVNADCSAQCSRLDKTKAEPLFCTNQLVTSQVGENVILQKELKRMRTVKLPVERCFAVTPDGKIAESAVIAELGAACGGKPR